MALLLTGGTGFIGSHTSVELLNAGYDIIIVDNLSNSSTKVLAPIKTITGKQPLFIQADLCQQSALNKLFEQHNIEGVIHFAGLKAVGESSTIPLDYYQNNVAGTVNLLQVMHKHQVKNMVFSSSATVYGENNPMPLVETMPTAASTPYGQTKWMIEQILFDLAKSDPTWSIILLRYFNPIGAHESGLIGEDPTGIPNNLLPYVAQVAVGRLDKLQIFGGDYATSDGTGVRDYIHVVDLAQGHVKAWQALDKPGACQAINLGTGLGTSVLEIVQKFQQISTKKIPYDIVARRPGDVASIYADPGKSLEYLSWQAEKDLDAMIRDTWRWQQKNPHGF